MLDAREKSHARRKSALIFNSKDVKEVHPSVGDLIEMFQKLDHEKGGKWSEPKPIISFNKKASSMRVPDKNGRVVVVAFKDTRFPLSQ